MENQKPIHVFATWKVADGNIETVLETLKTLSVESIKEKGNLFYTVHQSKTDVNTIVLFEGYVDEDAINEHRNSAHYKNLVLEKIVPLLENREVILASPIEY